MKVLNLKSSSLFTPYFLLREEAIKMVLRLGIEPKSIAYQAIALTY